MDNNTPIETQPVVEQTNRSLEAPVLQEMPVEPAVTEVSANRVQESSAQEAAVEISQDEVGQEVIKETPKPSAGFPIKNGSSEAQKILVEKLINKVVNL